MNTDRWYVFPSGPLASVCQIPLIWDASIHKQECLVVSEKALTPKETRWTRPVPHHGDSPFILTIYSRNSSASGLEDSWACVDLEDAGLSKTDYCWTTCLGLNLNLRNCGTDMPVTLLIRICFHSHTIENHLMVPAYSHITALGSKNFF